jgi:hypothetical protein
MRNPSRYARWIIFATALTIALVAAILMWTWSRSDRANRNRYESMDGWQQISGRWTGQAGVFTNSNYGRGDMLIAQRSQGANYRIAADVRFDLLFPETHYGDAGLVIRTTDPQQGVDSYQGYYAGLRPDNQTVVLGRASFDWHQLASSPLATPVSVGSWYRIDLSARGCKLTVTVTPVDNRAPTLINYDDDHCLASGVAGLRSFYAQASWRNIKISAD